MHQVRSLASFIAGAKAAGDLETKRLGCTFTVAEVDPLLGIDGNRDLLLADLMSLVHNAFKFTHDKSEVMLTASARGERTVIDIKDH